MRLSMSRIYLKHRFWLRPWVINWKASWRANFFCHPMARKNWIQWIEEWRIGNCRWGIWFRSEVSLGCNLVGIPELDFEWSSFLSFSIIFWSLFLNFMKKSRNVFAGSRKWTQLITLNTQLYRMHSSWIYRSKYVWNEEFSFRGHSEWPIRIISLDIK